ncbi:bis(5'-nucleosyl)-tetraphosphatase PrpE [Pseudalkalibacillus caeni]|uniref:Bis(5'-nucleosyl)-tetraphosphatase PrpE n=1 Tax=Exobacillus caeni TaxID=2574798 RepID=A0A5R9F5Y0_9BACL|nr:bis(5'-nucleosyl)-tetraphosphatase PrpE [Pseudalkalibacillus caeni]TLS37790.1 bis(5'-nucleosyl)-tetraphosphatase PrpE [Pseudalkalibacillus caeni]
MCFDIIGDIHGCYREFEQLTKKKGYSWEHGVPIHPEGRRLVFLGDLTDRGPASLSVVKSVYRLVELSKAYYTPGNHCDKLYRFLIGRNVQVTHGLETTVAELEQLDPETRGSISQIFKSLYENAPLYLTLDEGNLITAHAGIRQDYIGQKNKKVKTFVLYGDITGEKNPDGSPVRLDWAQKYDGKPLIVYGHTPVRTPRKVKNTINIDTGCVFGGSLTALRYPEMSTVSVPSSLPFVPEKFKSFD